MDKQIMNVIDKIAEKVGIAVDWSVDNVVPIVEDVIGRYITYQIIMSSIWCIVGIAMIISAIICLKLSLKNNLLYHDCYESYCKKSGFKTERELRRKYKIYENKNIAFSFVSGGCGLVGTPLFGVYLVKLIQLLTIPELIVLKELQSFL